MTVIGLALFLTALITVVTLWVAMMRDLWKRRDFNKQRAANIEQEQVWTALTEADRQWFQANLWDGKKVLDELPEPPKPPRPIDCKHANTVSERAIYDDANYCVCLECGIDWLDN